MVTKIFVIVTLALLASAIYMSPVDDRKPFDCPQNEIYYKCDLLVCFKKCDHLVNMPPCPSIAPGCYRPACECIDGYLRNQDGICIPVVECREQPACYAYIGKDYNYKENLKFLDLVV